LVNKFNKETLKKYFEAKIKEIHQEYE